MVAESKPAVRSKLGWHYVRKKMDCPECSDTEFYHGVLGPNCPNPDCEVTGIKREKKKAERSPNKNGDLHVWVQHLDWDKFREALGSGFLNHVDHVDKDSDES